MLIKCVCYHSETARIYYPDELSMERMKYLRYDSFNGLALCAFPSCLIVSLMLKFTCKNTQETSLEITILGSNTLFYEVPDFHCQWKFSSCVFQKDGFLSNNISFFPVNCFCYVKYI